MSSQENTEKIPKSIQVKLPCEMNSIFAEIKEKRSKNFESLSNTQIVIDAIKKYHATITSKN